MKHHRREDEDPASRLIRHLRRFPSAHEADEYLRALAELLSRLGASDGDPRVCLSTPKSTQHVLPLTLNQRYVLCYLPKHRRYGLVVPFGHTKDRGPWVFRPFRGERVPPDSAWVERLADLATGTPLGAAWLQAARTEWNRRKASGYAKHHNPLALGIVADEALRRAFLAMAHPGPDD